MSTRKELIRSTGDRYRKATRADRSLILDEFSKLSGYHRKHAIRLLSAPPAESGKRVGRQPIYDEAVRQTLVILWEASDRICGKRLKALIPSLVDSMQRHGHLSLDPRVHQLVSQMSAATIDRALGKVRGHHKRRRTGVGSAVRRKVPVRTFADWNDPPPGFFEVDMVEHCGGRKYDGNFVHSLVLTDIASGWTECIAMPVRNQWLVVQGFAQTDNKLPFATKGIDTDNDSAFMNDTVFNYCDGLGIELTRSRAYKKNDQAWVEQKNGSVVRRLVGYNKLTGTQMTEALAQLYEASRLYVNFFQPSFKLKTKTRIGARVHKTYHPPLTPCDRLLQHDAISIRAKTALRRQLMALDPVKLLQQIRMHQQTLTELSDPHSSHRTTRSTSNESDVSIYLKSLATAWQHAEIRPTHRPRRTPARWWRTRVDPFEADWSMVLEWLALEPAIEGKQIMARLNAIDPENYPDNGKLRTLQRRIKQWRLSMARELVSGRLAQQAEDVSPAASAAGETSNQPMPTTIVG